MTRIWLIVVSVALGLLWIGTAITAEEEVNEYVGDNAKKCNMCHKAQVAAWAEWPMASSWDNLSDEEKKKDECVSCHVTGFGEPGGFVDEETTPKLVGIQCEACHGPMGFHIDAPMTDKEKKMATVSEPDEANCKTCHKKEGNPNFKEFKYEEAVEALADHLKPEK